MIVLDFLFYYLWRWFIRRKLKVVNLIPETQTCYVIAISLMLWLMCIITAIEFKIYHHYHFKTPKLVYIICFIIIRQILGYIYISKSRKDKIDSIKFKVNESVGIGIGLAFLVLSVLIPLGYARHLHFLIKAMGHIPRMD